MDTKAGCGKLSLQPMRTILLLAAILVVLIFLLKILSLKLTRCPKCKKRGVKVIEKTRFWVKFKCDRCGNTYVEQTGH